MQGKPTLLVKPLGGDGHGGGMRFTEDSPEYAALVEFIERLEKEDTCVDEPEALLFDGVDVLGWQGSLRSMLAYWHGGRNGQKQRRWQLTLESMPADWCG